MERNAKTRLMRYPDSTRRHLAVAAWIEAHADELGAVARRWFEVLCASGSDVREILHDGQPTACVGDAAFAHVDMKARVRTERLAGVA
jgi:hypothetical protein